MSAEQDREKGPAFRLPLILNGGRRKYRSWSHINWPKRAEYIQSLTQAHALIAEGSGWAAACRSIRELVVSNCTIMLTSGAVVNQVDGRAVTKSQQAHHQPCFIHKATE